MSKISLRTETKLVIVAFCISCCAMTGCVESRFTLASESRLPRFVTPPPGLARSDVSVTLTYYTVGDAKIILKNRKGQKLKEIDAKVLREKISRFYPRNEIVVANGITEILEYGGPGIFYVTDDPTIRKRLLGDERSK